MDVLRLYCKYTFFVRCEKKSNTLEMSVPMINSVESRAVVFMVNIHEIIILRVSTADYKISAPTGYRITFSFIQIPICFLIMIFFITIITITIPYYYWR